MNHVPHILAAVFLCGLWLPIWIIMAVSYVARWHCAFCGYSDEPKYLRNPNLREQERVAAVQREAFRNEVVAARGEDLSFGERISFWISDNKLTAILSVMAFIGIVVAAVIVEVSNNRYWATQTVSTFRPTPTGTPSSPKSQFASTIQAELQPTYPDVSVSVEGPNAQTLVINSSKINDAVVKTFQENHRFSNRMRIAGFESVRYTTGRVTWNIKLKD